MPTVAGYPFPPGAPGSSSPGSMTACPSFTVAGGAEHSAQLDNEEPSAFLSRATVDSEDGRADVTTERVRLDQREVATSRLPVSDKGRVSGARPSPRSIVRR